MDRLLYPLFLLGALFLLTTFINHEPVEPHKYIEARVHINAVKSVAVMMCLTDSTEASHQVTPASIDYFGERRFTR